MHNRPPSADPAGPIDREGAYNVRSVPVRIYLPDGPVIQELIPPALQDGKRPFFFSFGGSAKSLLLGTPRTLEHFLQEHLPLLFPARPPPPPPSRTNPNPQAPASPELAYVLLQGVVAPLDSEVAWLGACLAGADGWLNMCIGLR